MGLENPPVPEIEPQTVDLADFSESAIQVPYPQVVSQPGFLDHPEEMLPEPGLHIISQKMFIPSEKVQQLSQPIAADLSEQRWGITTLLQPEHFSELGGVQIEAVSGAPVLSIRQGVCTVGGLYEDRYARYCRLCGLHPLDGEASAENQIRELLENMQLLLGSVDFGFAHVLRTWYYIDNIIDTYDLFNTERTAFFERQGIRSGILPASTAVGLYNPGGTALVAELLAVAPRDTDAVVRPATSPRQGPAAAYGSDFNRATIMETPDFRRLWISGTSAIDQHGRSLHSDDVHRQIETTLETVADLLEQEGFAWDDCLRGTAYLKNPEDLGAWQALSEKNHLPAARILPVAADLCREELLFELEVEAVRATDG